MVEFLSPVSKNIRALQEILPEGSLGKKIEAHVEKGQIPSLKNIKIALLGIKENRNDVDYIGEILNFDAIREAFYSLFPGNWHHKVVDLGDIAQGNTPKDSYFALKTVHQALLEKNIIPILLGGSQEITYAQYRSYDKFGKMLNLVNVDHKFDLGDAEQPINNKSYVGKIIVDQPYHLFNYTVIGYQSFLNAPQEIALMDRLYFDAYRLGVIIDNIPLVETLCRDADIVNIDVTAINATYLSYPYKQSANGFNSREICAIARYAGISNRVSSFGVYELKNFNKHPQAAALIAQVLWYFIEGVNFRVEDEDFTNEKDYKTYKVPINDEVLTFKKSLKTERWWIELPFILNVNNKLKKHTLLPCTYQEYVSATQQEIPERWLKARRKNEV